MLQNRVSDTMTQVTLNTINNVVRPSPRYVAIIPSGSKGRALYEMRATLTLSFSKEKKLRRKIMSDISSYSKGGERKEGARAKRFLHVHASSISLTNFLTHSLHFPSLHMLLVP